MQEHIRRAHPDHYIPKLPATEESFQKMVNTPPEKRLQQATTISQSKSSQSSCHYIHQSTWLSNNVLISNYSERETYGHPAPTAVAATQGKPFDDQPALANAAEALAQLHHTCAPHRPEWDSEPVSFSSIIHWFQS